MAAQVKFIDGFFTVNGIFPDDTYDAADLKRLFGPLPDLKDIKAMRKVKPVRELIRAWDPVAQKDRVGARDLERHPRLRRRGYVDAPAISCSKAAAAADCGCTPPTPARS